MFNNYHKLFICIFFLALFSLRCDFEGFLVVFSRPFAKRPPRPRVVRLPNFYLVERVGARAMRALTCQHTRQKRAPAKLSPYWPARSLSHISREGAPNWNTLQRYQIFHTQLPILAFDPRKTPFEPNCLLRMNSLWRTGTYQIWVSQSTWFLGLGIW